MEKMLDLSVEQKLEIVRQIKDQYNQNQFDLSNRKRILYGTIDSYEYGYEKEQIERMDVVTHKAKFSIRVMLSIILLTAYILCDILQVSPYGIDMHQIYQIIASDYSETVIEVLNQTVLQQSAPQA